MSALFRLNGTRFCGLPFVHILNFNIQPHRAALLREGRFPRESRGRSRFRGLTLLSRDPFGCPNPPWLSPSYQFLHRIYG